jgi:hypothetical protein
MGEPIEGSPSRPKAWRALLVTQIPAALIEWRNPQHPDFARDDKTDWRLFNAVTEALKEGNYMDLPRRTQALHGLEHLSRTAWMTAV